MDLHYNFTGQCFENVLNASHLSQSKCRRSLVVLSSLCVLLFICLPTVCLVLFECHSDNSPGAFGMHGKNDLGMQPSAEVKILIYEVLATVGNRDDRSL